MAAELACAVLSRELERVVDTTDIGRVVDEADAEGNTPLNRVCARNGGVIEEALALLQAGAAVNAANNRAWYAIGNFMLCCGERVRGEVADRWGVL
jgi:hypothetical protein